MLQNMRDKAQGWIAWLIVGAIATTFILFGANSIFTSNSFDNTAITVNKEKISHKEISDSLERIMQNMSQEQVQVIDQNYLKDQIIQSLIQEKLLTQAAKNYGMQIKDAKITNTILDLPFLYVDGKFSKENYSRFLANLGITEAEFKTRLNDQLIINQLQDGIVSSDFALPKEIEEYIALRDQERVIDLINIKIEDFEDKIQVSDKQVEDYYEENKNSFKTKEKFQLEYVKLTADNVKTEVTIENSELEKYYQDNIKSFTDQERLHLAHILITNPKTGEKTAKEIYKKLQNGADFAKLAQEHSDDTYTKTKAGDLSWVQKGELVEEFEQAAFSIEQAGGISKPVQTKFGWHIIKLLDKQPEKVQEFKQVANEIKQKLSIQKKQDELVELADQLVSVAYDVPDSLEPAAEKLNIPIQKTQLIAIDELANNKDLNSPKVIAALNTDYVKLDKNNSDLIQLDDGNYLIIRVANIIEPKIMELADVKSQIKDILVFDGAKQLAENQAIEQLNKIQASNFKKLAGSWEQDIEVTRDTMQLDPNLVEAVFSMPNPKYLSGLKDIKLAQELSKTVAGMNGDQFIVRLKQVNMGKPEAINSEAKSEIGKQYATQIGQYYFALLAKSLETKAKIERKS